MELLDIEASSILLVDPSTGELRFELADTMDQNMTNIVVPMDLFLGLPPGKYRLLASLELDPSDRAAMEAAHPAEVSVTAGGSALHDLSLYHRP